MAGKRRKRAQEFAAEPTGKVNTASGLSPQLLTCAEALLHLALKERSHITPGSTADHPSDFAVGSILLLIAAFESWLNEVILQLCMFQHLDRASLGGLPTEPILSKYSEIPKQLGREAALVSSDLELLVALRHEIAHHLPYLTPTKGWVPSSLAALREKGLLYDYNHPEVGPPFSDMICSYRLAWWSWEVIEEAVSSLVQALGAAANVACGTSGNFGHYRRLCPPYRPAEWDRRQRPSVA